MSSWGKIRRHVIAGAALVGGAAATILSGGTAAPLTVPLVAAAIGVGASAAAAVEGGYQMRDAQKAAKEQARAIEAEAKKGVAVQTEEAATIEDSVGNAAWKRRQAALAASSGTGREGTRISSSLGAGGSLG